MLTDLAEAVRPRGVAIDDLHLAFPRWEIIALVAEEVVLNAVGTRETPVLLFVAPPDDLRALMSSDHGG
jgi:hypothetical protein